LEKDDLRVLGSQCKRTV